MGHKIRKVPKTLKDNDISFTFKWVKAYSSILTNEAADRKAKNYLSNQNAVFINTL